MSTYIVPSTLQEVKVKVVQSCPTLCNPMDCPWISLGQNTGVGSLSLLQGIFSTQESNWGLLQCRQILYQLGYQGSPNSRRSNLLSFCKKVEVKWKSFSCVQLFDPMDYTVHGILQARTVEWVAIPFFRGPSQPRDQTQVSHIAGRFFISWATREAQEYWSG